MSEAKALKRQQGNRAGYACMTGSCTERHMCVPLCLSQSAAQVSAETQQVIQAVSAQLAEVTRQEDTARAQLQSLESEMAEHQRKLPPATELPPGASLVRMSTQALVVTAYMQWSPPEFRYWSMHAARGSCTGYASVQPAPAYAEPRSCRQHVVMRRDVVVQW